MAILSTSKPLSAPASIGFPKYPTDALSSNLLVELIDKEFQETQAGF